MWQVIAIGRANLSLTAMGLALGGNARAGLEDALYPRKGELSPGNVPLVQRAVRLARDLDLGAPASRKPRSCSISHPAEIRQHRSQMTNTRPDSRVEPVVPGGGAPRGASCRNRPR